MSRPLLMSLFDETERRPLSVSELTSQVRGALEGRFASVWVEGEISNFKQATSGHWYFSVRDEAAQLRATCFRGVNSRIRFRPSDGLLVRVRGRMTVYEPRGEYEMIVEALDPVGAGALRVAFEQLKERGAAAEVARAIQTLNEHHLRAAAEGRADGQLDVIIVGRGGGSSEDLWAFNAEEVARAIRASAVPVISAVGHETDFTIADFAADVRAATPTAAAEIVPAREDEMTAIVATLSRDLVRAVEYRLLIERERVHEAVSSEGFDEVRERLREAGRATAELARRLETVMTRTREGARRR